MIKERLDKPKTAFKGNYDLILFLLALIPISIMLIKKCRYGIGNIDESFYLTIPLRLVKGDSLFVNEWHPSQLAGLLLCPLVKVFLTLNGNTDGIILTFRHIYVVVQILATVAIYGLMRKRDKYGALVGAVFFLIYAPFGIMALSYNSLSIIFLSLSLVLLINISSPVALGLSGLLFAMAVLAQPYLAILYFIYAVVVFIYKISRKALVSEELLTWKRFGCFTVGVVLAAVIFVTYMLSKAKISDIIAAIPYILSDPEHQSTFLFKLAYYPYCIFFSNILMPFVCIAYAVTCLVGMVKKELKVKNRCLVVMMVLTFINQLIWAFEDGGYINYLMLPLNFLALFCYVTYRNEKVKLIFDGIWIPGMLYTFFVHLASNQRLYAISSSSTVALIGSVIIILVTVRDVNVDLKVTKKVALSGIMAVLMAFQLGSELCYRWNEVYWEYSIKSQLIDINYGPEKGLVISESANYIYSNYYSDLEYLNENAENVLFLSPYTWLYICGDWGNASYSAWIAGTFEQVSEKLDAYYAMNPDKLPDAIFVDSCNGDYVDILEEKYGFVVEKVTEIGNIIMVPVT